MSHKENIQEILKGCSHYTKTGRLCMGCRNGLSEYLKAVKVTKDKINKASKKSLDFASDIEDLKKDCEEAIEIGEKI